MKAKPNRRLAMGLIVAPILVGCVMRIFGARPLILRWEGPLLHPTGISFDIQNFGFVLVVTFLVGTIWLICSLLRQLFSKSESDEKRA